MTSHTPDGNGPWTPVLTNLTQVAVVVEDLQATMESYHRMLGWGPWKVYEFRPPLYQDLRVRGQSADYGVLVAETTVGELAFELLQPLEGVVNPYREWLDAHGEGLHHIAFMVESEQAASAIKDRLEGLGIPELTSGRVGDAFEFSFYDAMPQLKIIFETGTGHSQDLIKPARVYPPQSHDD